VEREPRQVCGDGADNDGDGVIDLLDGGCKQVGLPVHPGYGHEYGCGADTVDDDGDGAVNDGCPVVGTAESGSQCSNATDDDADSSVNDGCPVVNVLCPVEGCPGIDTDGDGYTDEAEMSIGTDALGRCEVGAAPAMSTDWPSDLVSGGIPDSTDRITLVDVLSFTAPVYRINTYPGHPGFDRRWDLQPGTTVGTNWISNTDVLMLTANTAAGYPPMFGGGRAFNGPACTAHPVYGD